MISADRRVALAKDENGTNQLASSCPEWEAIWPARQVSAHALRRVMRRKLPLASDHLLKLSEWIASAETQSDWSHPLKAFVKAIERTVKLIRRTRRCDYRCLTLPGSSATVTQKTFPNSHIRLK